MDVLWASGPTPARSRPTIPFWIVSVLPTTRRLARPLNVKAFLDTYTPNFDEPGLPSHWGARLELHCFVIFLSAIMAPMSDLLGDIENSLAGEASKQAIALLTQYLSRWNVSLSSSQERLETAVAEHQKEIKNWSEEISFKDLLRPKVTSEVFVPLAGC
jgi:hypothetical protein